MKKSTEKEYHFSVVDEGSAVEVLVERFYSDNGRPAGWVIYRRESYKETPGRRIDAGNGAFPWGRDGFRWDPCDSKEHAECLLNRRLP